MSDRGYKRQYEKVRSELKALRQQVEKADELAGNAGYIVNNGGAICHGHMDALRESLAAYLALKEQPEKEGD
jgi:hypothetical protein